MENDLNIYEVDGKKYIYHIPSNSIIPTDSEQGFFLKEVLEKGVENLNFAQFSQQSLTTIHSLIACSSQDEQERTQIKKIAISPTMKCNLNCTYCYNYQEGPQDQVRGLPDLAEVSILKIIESLGELNIGNKLQVAFIGGEPFVKLEILKQCIHKFNEFGRENGIEMFYSVTTNGLVLGKSEIVEFINANSIAIQVSLDGPAVWNDEYRIDLKAEGSYALVVKNLEYFFKHFTGQYLSVRGTPKLIPGRLIGTYTHLRDLGFRIIGMSAADFETEDLSPETKELLLQEVTELCDLVKSDLLSNRVKKFSWLADVFQNLYFGKAKTVVCGACKSYIAFDTKGSPQVCHRYLGNERQELRLEDLINPTDSKFLKALFPSGKTVNCPTCKVRSLCGGECYHISEQFSRQGNYASKQEFLCEFKRRMYHSALKSFIQIYEQDPKLLREIVMA